ncbi:TPA: SDR family oxidoreductase [Enterococcus faecalis]|uniref:SDR family oxidoreductase n=1 Tax=Enterococcus sp. DIV0086 TaxID=2774655 RepID=UPI0029865C64|nr:SDR family oxidoreductase [Enterococcus faecalis]HBI1662552.1 SDR family oxidoreductase [Enterococcus faecalis]HBI1691395.1 SDR family oxidoreductase [Enterococcus faecalis]HBI1697197.1 SDR family oxidoreductase [Enterococcus faecalis]HBI1699956.1 SDR family oxidoreductase [Enterococcus faecalis]
MNNKVWLITGVSSGFGYELTKQLLEKGETVVGTVRSDKNVREFMKAYPDTFFRQFLDVTEVKAINDLVKNVYKKLGRIDVVISNAGYGLFGAAEELTDEEIDQIIATNLTGSIQLVRSVLPFMRKQGYGRIVQISSYGGQVAFAGNSLYHATKWGIEGFVESVAKEVAPFNIGMTIVEPGGARTQFRYGSAQVANLMSEYNGNPAHAFLTMLNPDNGLAAGDPEKMATRIIESVDVNPAPMRLVLGSQALNDTINVLEERIKQFKAQADIAASTDIID